MLNDQVMGRGAPATLSARKHLVGERAPAWLPLVLMAAGAASLSSSAMFWTESSAPAAAPIDAGVLVTKSEVAASQPTFCCKSIVAPLPRDKPAPSPSQAPAESATAYVSPLEGKKATDGRISPDAPGAVELKFGDSSAALQDKSARTSLKPLADWLAACAHAELLVETDIGTNDDKVVLSYRRLQAVGKELVQSGAASERVKFRLTGAYCRTSKCSTGSIARSVTVRPNDGQNTNCIGQKP